MKRTLTGVAGAALLVLAVTGCGASDAAPVPTTTSVETPVAEKTGTTLRELQELYVDAGGQCDNPQRRATSAVADESADCENGALLSVYSSQTQRDSAIYVLKGLQDTNPSPHVIAAGPDWTVNGADAGSFAATMGGESIQIGDPVPPAASVDPTLDLTTDAGLCAADAEITSLELNDALAPVLGYPADRDLRTSDQDDAIRAYKNAAFERACPARAG